MNRLLSTILFFLTAFCLNAQTSRKSHEFLYWENLTTDEIKNFIRNTTIPESAAGYYEGDFTPTDNEATFGLLDYLSNDWTPDTLQAFKFMLFNKILLFADGALSEALPEYTYPIILSHTDYILKYLTSDRSLEDRYAVMIGVALCLIDESKNTNESLSEIEMLVKLSATGRRFKKRFLHEIGKYYKIMSD